MKTLPEHFLFMKVGNHAGETFDQILERKRKELKKAGSIFWGYGGVTCHPTQQVQPFVRTFLRSGSLYLMMQTIKSNADPAIAPATEYSIDGITWVPIPKGVNVLGSKYALVLDEIYPGDLDFNLNNYQVGVGSSEGKIATDYLQGRVDKGCFVKAGNAVVGGDESMVRKINYFAKLKEPYAVFLRG